MNQHDVIRTLMTFDDQLDDIKRARIWAQLEDKLEGDVAPRARRRRWPLAVAAVSVAAAAAVVLSLRPTPDTANTLAVPAATTVTSQIGPHTRAAIVGPAQVDFVGAAGEATTVRVRRGTLLADFTGGAGRSLRIETRAAVVEVVGTVFSVEARGDVTCTSVVHGRVRVTMRSAVREVAAGERFCTDDAAVRPIDVNVRDALERHRAVITAHAMPAQPPTAIGSASAPAISAVEPTSGAASTSADAPTSVGAASPASAAAASPASRAPAPSASTPTASTGSTSTAAVPSPRESMKPLASISSTSPKPRASPSAASTPARPPSPTTSPRTSASERPAEPGMSPAAAAPSPSAPASLSPSSSVPTSASPSSTAASAPPSTGVAASTSPIAPGDVTPPSKPRATPDELYRTAEKALAARDPKTADRVLAALVTEYPASPLVDQALYERARIAYQQRAWTVARGHLDRLAAIKNTGLAEPGHYLRCRISVEARDAAAAATCFTDYRARFPRSPHDLEALGVLAQHTYAKGGCAQASAFVAELASSYPRTTLAAAWRTRCPEPRR